MFRRKWLSSERPTIWLAPTVITLFLITIVPTLFLFFTSLHWWELGYPWDARRFIGFDNFSMIFSSPQFLHSFKVTGIYTVSSLAIQLVVGFAIALYLSQKTLRWRGLLTALLIIPMTVTPSIAGLIWRLYYNPNYGIVNYFLETVFGVAPNWYSYDWALPSVILVDVWQWTPFIALILLAGLSALPQAPFEAARVDGASWWQTMRYVTLPLLRPIILIAVLLRLMDALKMFDVVFALTEGGPANATELLSMQIYRTGFYQTGMVGLAASMAVVLLVIIITLSQMFIKVLDE